MAREISLPYNWSPRIYQQNLWSYMLQNKPGLRAAAVWHRRAGKDLTAINICTYKAVQRVGLYWHLFPTYKQGRQALWNGADKSGRRFLSYIPQEIIKSTNNTDMRVELANGSFYQVCGTEDINKLVGTNPIGVVLSEYSVMSPNVWNLLSPILAENGGWALFIFTARGKNFAYELYNSAQRNPKDWFSEKLVAGDAGTKREDGSPVVSDEDIDKERRSGVPEEMIQQEFYNSFEGAMVGAYYGPQLKWLLDNDRITNVPHDPKLPVDTWWDLGISETSGGCAIWFTQVHGMEVRVINYYENSGEGLAHYAKVLKGQVSGFEEMGAYTYGTHNAPHDIEIREISSGKSRIEFARGLGLRFKVVRKHNVDDGIEAVRSLLPICYFDKDRCDRDEVTGKRGGRGIEMLRNYTKVWDDKNKCYKDHPLHNFASHGCFTGDTKVLTPYGIRQIKDLEPIGKVLTLCGWKQYHLPRITKRNAQLVEVAFTDGHIVRCTPEHLFLTESGWKSAESLESGMLIRSSLTPSLNTLKEVFTGFGRRSVTILGEAKASIEWHGQRLLEKFQRIATSTIGTATQQTICFQTSNASPLGSIYDSHGQRGRNPSRGMFISQITPEQKRQSGIAPKQEECGTEGTPSGPKAGQSGSVLKRIASGAKYLSTRLFGMASYARGFVPTSVKQLRIGSVKRLQKTQDVWCITVPDYFHFSLENGAVVHNSDAFRQFAWGHKERPKWNQPPQLNAIDDHDYVGASYR